MKAPIWNDPFAPMPDSFERRLDQTLAQLEGEGMKRKYKMGAALAATLVLVIILSAAALAATRSAILRQWFRDQAPPEATERLLARPEESVTRDGITLALDEYIADGELITIQWSVTSSREDAVAFIGDAPSLGKGFSNTISGGFAGTRWEMEGMNVLGGGNPMRADATASYTVSGERRGEPVLAEFTLAVYEHGQTPNTAQPLFELALACTLQPADPMVTRVDGRSTFEFDHYTLTVERLDFTATSTVFEWTLTSKEPVEIATRAKGQSNMGTTDPLLLREYVLLDAQGNWLTRGCEGLGSYDGVETTRLEDGRGQLHGSQKWSPLASVPEEVTLMPYQASSDVLGTYISEGMDVEQAIVACYIREEAVTVRVADP